MFEKLAQWGDMPVEKRYKYEDKVLNNDILIFFRR